MRKYLVLVLIVLSFSIIPQQSHTKTANPPVTIWTEFSAVSNVDLDNYSLTGADTVGVSSHITFGDNTELNTSPQACSAGEALNNGGCESLAAGETDPTPQFDAVGFSSSNDTQTRPFKVSCEESGAFCSESDTITISSGSTAQINFTQNFEHGTVSITENVFYRPGSLSSDRAAAIAINRIEKNAEGNISGVVLRNGNAGSSHTAEITVFGILVQ